VSIAIAYDELAAAYNRLRREAERLREENERLRDEVASKQAGLLDLGLELAKARTALQEGRGVTDPSRINWHIKENWRLREENERLREVLEKIGREPGPVVRWSQEIARAALKKGEA
jgi:cell division septum initiation protein DivIVA